MRWGTVRVADDVMHVIPLDDAFDHEVDEAGDCVCGPDAVRDPATEQHQDRWRYDHHRLDRTHPPDPT